MGDGYLRRGLKLEERVGNSIFQSTEVKTG
jgi:hypothetical protein